MKNLIILFWLTLNVNCFSQNDTCLCKLPYTTYVAILNQESTNPPVATVLENTTGFTFDWYYDSTGNYYSDALPSNSLAVVFSGSTEDYHFVRNTLYNGTYITISQAQYFWNDEYMPFDGFNNYAIEIRVY